MTQTASGKEPTGHVPGRSHEAAGAPLAGRVVLLPRVKERDRIAAALERAGARVLRAAVTRTVPGDAAALEAFARRITAGKAAWLVLTSARTIEALAPYLPAETGIRSTAGGQEHHGDSAAPLAGSDAATTPTRVAASRRQQCAPRPLPVRVAVVGPATARAWTELTGFSPDLVARGSATALLEEPELAEGPARSDAHQRLLLPASALADPALADGLRRAGWQVEQVAAYTTVTAEPTSLPPGLTRAWAAGGVDAVVLTAPSTTRAVLELLSPPRPETRLVAIGATTAAAARDLGLAVGATATSPTPEGVLQAVIAAIVPTTATTTSNPTTFTTPRSTS